MSTFSHNDNFEPGRLIIAIYRNHPFPCTTTCYEYILNGVDYKNVRVIFTSNESASDVGDVILVCLTCQKKTTVVDLVEELAPHPYVVHAEPSFVVLPHSPPPPVIPNDRYFEQLWGLKSVKAPLAWNYAVGSSDVVVGVIDSGIDYTHQDIRENMWVSPSGHYGWNFFDDNSETMDLTGHGTHVAGTVGAIGNNIIGVTGVCWNIKIASLKIGNSYFTIAAAIAAINYANENNIPILNNGWGTHQNSESLKHAIDHYGGLFVASAGNAGANSDIFPDYPSAFGNPNILTVAASNQDDDLADFSNYGEKSVDIAAPGDDILSLSLYGEYSPQRGTSMSAPYASGAAALLKSYRPDLTALEIKNRIIQSATPHPGLINKVLSGGILDIYKMFSDL